MSAGLPPERLPAARTTMALVGGVALAVLVVHATYYLPFVSDDALISLRYARRLLQGHGLTWTDGRPVEGYSNLLWILCVAALGRLGVDLIDATRVLGLGCGGLALWALLRSFPARVPRDALPAAAGAGALVLSAPIAVWTVGGLEQPLVAALLAWATSLGFALVEGRASTGARLGLALALGGLCLARPDGPIFTAGTLAALALAPGERRERYRAALAIAWLPALCVAGQLAFRLAVYGEWLPNPAYVKIAPSARHQLEGLAYVGLGLLWLSPVSEIALGVAALGSLGSLGAGARRRARLRLLLVQSLAWLAYVAAIGGDIFPAYRHLAPVAVLFAFALAEGAAWWCERRPSARAWRRAVTVLAASLAIEAVLALRSHESRRALAERFEWRGREVALALRRAFASEQPLVAVTAAGCIPYWSELPALDLLGLNDHHLARHRPPNFGQGRLAHELGDAAYVLAREPDLILYHVGKLGSDLRIGRELDAQPQYHDAYTPIALELDEPAAKRFAVWVRLESPRVGVRRDEDGVEIPGHLFAAHGVGIARPDETGRFTAVVGRGTPGLAERIALPPGAWRLEVEASGRTFARVREHETGDVLAEGVTPLDVDVGEAGGRGVDVQLLAPAMTQVRVRGARLSRVPEGSPSPSRGEERAARVDGGLHPWVRIGG